MSCADNIEVLISEAEIDEKIREMAKELDRDYFGKPVVFLCTLKGSVFFACELAKRVSFPVFMEFIRASSYFGMSSTGNVEMKIDVPLEAIEGKDVIVIEDIIDTGVTLTYIKEIMSARNPASLKFCSLLDKHECRKVPFEGDYVGFVIGDEFVVGYGLDWDEKYRNLPYVGVVR